MANRSGEHGSTRNCTNEHQILHQSEPKIVASCELWRACVGMAKYDGVKSTTLIFAPRGEATSIKYYLNSAPHKETRLQIIQWFCLLQGDEINRLLLWFRPSWGGDVHTTTHWFCSCKEARLIYVLLASIIQCICDILHIDILAECRQEKRLCTPSSPSYV